MSLVLCEVFGWISCVWCWRPSELRLDAIRYLHPIYYCTHSWISIFWVETMVQSLVAALLVSKKSAILHSSWESIPPVPFNSFRGLWCRRNSLIYTVNGHIIRNYEVLYAIQRIKLKNLCLTTRVFTWLESCVVLIWIVPSSQAFHTYPIQFHAQWFENPKQQSRSVADSSTQIIPRSSHIQILVDLRAQFSQSYGSYYLLLELRVIDLDKVPWRRH